MGNNDTQEKHLLVTLALIQKAIEDLNIKVTNHQIVLFGNGKMDDSVVWNIKQLNLTVDKVVKQMDKIVEKFETEDSENKKLPWNLVFKKVLLKAPYAIGLIVAIILLYEPATNIIISVLKLFKIITGMIL